MRQKFIYITILASIFSMLFACQKHEPKKTIGIILPIEHKALNKIIAGFTDTLKKEKNSLPIDFKIANAQGDLNLQQAIVSQMKSDRYDLVVAIGTAVTQMATKLINNKPILSLASIYNERDRNAQKNCHIAIVHDEISPKYMIHFIHQVYPQLSQLTLIHSADDKSYSQIRDAIAAGKSVGIQIKPLLVPSLNELYSIANALSPKTQGILILKDNLIASGIGTLVQTSKKRHIPLITSDEGTVTDGADFAMGVSEKQIGVEGANLVKSILSGKKACDLPVVKFKKLHIFVNRKKIPQDSLFFHELLNAAQKNGYVIEMVS